MKKKIISLLVLLLLLAVIRVSLSMYPLGGDQIPPISESPVVATSTYPLLVAFPTRGSTLVTGKTYVFTWTQKNASEYGNDNWVYLTKESVPAEYGDRSLGGHIVNIGTFNQSASSTTVTIPEYLQSGDDYRIVFSEVGSARHPVVGYSDTFAIQRSGTTTSKVDPGIVAAVNAVSLSPLGKRIEAAAPGTFDPARIGHDLRGFVSVYAHYYKSKNVYLVELYLDVDGHCYRGEEGCLMTKVFTAKELDAARGTVPLAEFVGTESDITFDVTPEGKVSDYKITSAMRSDADSRREQLKAEGYY